MSSSGKNKGALRGWEMLHALWNWNRHDVYKAASSEKISQLCVISCSLLLRFTVKNEWKIIPHAIFSFLRVVVVYARSGHWGVHFIRISKWDFKIAGASRIRLGGERELFLKGAQQYIWVYKTGISYFPKGKWYLLLCKRFAGKSHNAISPPLLFTISKGHHKLSCNIYNSFSKWNIVHTE